MQVRKAKIARKPVPKTGGNPDAYQHCPHSIKINYWR